MATPNEATTAYEILHGATPASYRYRKDLVAYPEGIFPDPLSLEYSPVFEPRSLEFGEYYFRDNELESLFLLDCGPVFRLLVLARERVRLQRVNYRHLVALFNASVPALVGVSSYC